MSLLSCSITSSDTVPGGPGGPSVPFSPGAPGSPLGPGVPGTPSLPGIPGSARIACRGDPVAEHDSAASDPVTRTVNEIVNNRNLLKKAAGIAEGLIIQLALSEFGSLPLPADLLGLLTTCHRPDFEIPNV